MKKIYKFFGVLFISFIPFIINVKAENTMYVNIENNKISDDGIVYKNIEKYDTLEKFLEDYNSNKLPKIYLTSFLFDGVSSVKSPDLDDFIENNSNDTKINTLKINVLNINTSANIELTGTSKKMMIGVNTNNIKGNINIILNNVNIDTDTKKAPVIYVYNKDRNYTDCKVIIKTKKNTKNYLEGGKLKKVSLIPSDNLNDYKKYYSNDELNNYEKYSSYYGIYTKEELKNILFAPVTADEEGLKDSDPYVFYKASGAISSDIDLYFEGEGYLKVTSKNKEGIETKGNLSFDGGTGDYEINAHDDCLNTTTSNNTDGNVRNKLTIDVKSLVAIVNDDADEGDAIDSNGELIINGGNIYAFAHSKSPDAGLDSENGTYINGGTIIATGNMIDRISQESDQKYIYASFKTKIEKNTLIVIENQNNEIIAAFKTEKDITSLFYSTEDLKYDSYKIFTGGTIDGKETNGLYTKINNYTTGNEIEYTDVSNYKNIKNKDTNAFIKNMLIIEIIGMFIIIMYILYEKHLLKTNNKIHKK